MFLKNLFTIFKLISKIFDTYKILRKKVYPVHTKQKQYPILFYFVRMVYLFKKAFDHLRFMDFSVLPGKPGYYLWKFGVISFWRRFILKNYRLSNKELKHQSITTLSNQVEKDFN